MALRDFFGRTHLLLLVQGGGIVVHLGFGATLALPYMVLGWQGGGP